jgi:hypothetical protein
LFTEANYNDPPRAFRDNFSLLPVGALGTAAPYCHKPGGEKNLLFFCTLQDGRPVWKMVHPLVIETRQVSGYGRKAPTYIEERRYRRVIWTGKKHSHMSADLLEADR